MARMGKYCKAYPMERFREYSKWTENPAAPGANTTEQAGGEGNKYFFLHDTYIVTRGVYVDEMIVFDSVTEDWIAFCREKLQFEVPEFVTAGAA